MRHPAAGRVWSIAEINADCIQAEQAFRLRRTSEPLEDYLAEFDTAKAAADDVIDRLPEILAEPANRDLLGKLTADRDLSTALRYLAAPPISEDDLDTLLSTKVTARAIRADPALAQGLVDLIRQTIDPKRFPWIRERVAPTKTQLNAAKLASAVAATIQRVQTKRRGDEKKALEGAVESVLMDMGYERIPSPQNAITNFREVPAAGKYMTCVTLGSDNADCAVGLSDGRCLALECKSSNSPINSRKRLNKEVVKDAENWRRTFGAQLVAGAVLRGVFVARYVRDAQETPLLIFWEHRLDDLRSFIESAQ